MTYECEDCPADDSYWCDLCSFLADTPNSSHEVQIEYHFVGKAEPILQRWEEDEVGQKKDNDQWVGP